MLPFIAHSLKQPLFCIPEWGEPAINSFDCMMYGADSTLVYAKAEQSHNSTVVASDGDMPHATSASPGTHAASISPASMCLQYVHAYACRFMVLPAGSDPG